MKKRAVISSLVLAGLSLNLAVPTVLGAVVDTYDKAKATVKFEAGDDIDGDAEEPITPPVVPPVGPTDPNPPHGGNSGKLVLSVPKVLEFGTNKIKDTDMKAYANLVTYTEIEDATTSYKLPPMFVVKDIRGKADGAWNLSGSLSEFKSGNKVLAGATISFLQGQGFNSGIKGSNPTGQEDLLITAANTDFMIKRDTFTFNEQEQALMSSQNGAGRGETTFIADSRYTVDAITNNTYDTETKDNGIELFIPSSAVKEVNAVGYEATFTWTISDTMDGQ